MVCDNRGLTGGAILCLHRSKLLEQSLSTHAQSLSHVQLFATPWTVACQAPLSMGYSRQEYWSGFPFPPPGDLSDAGIKPVSPVAPALADRFFITELSMQLNHAPEHYS